MSSLENFVFFRVLYLIVNILFRLVTKPHEFISKKHSIYILLGRLYQYIVSLISMTKPHTQRNDAKSDTLFKACHHKFQTFISMNINYIADTNVIVEFENKHVFDKVVKAVAYRKTITFKKSNFKTLM